MKPILITHNGKTQKISEWSRDTGIKYATLYQRYILGYPPEKILSTACFLMRPGERPAKKQW